MLKKIQNCERDIAIANKYISEYCTRKRSILLMLNRLSPKNCGEQGCQIFLGTTYQNRKQIYQITTKHIKCPQNIPNVHKTYQMPVQYVDKMSMTYVYQHLPLQDPQKITQIWTFGLKICHLTTLVVDC
jgi:hypothetical protein